MPQRVGGGLLGWEQWEVLAGVGVWGWGGSGRGVRVAGGGVISRQRSRKAKKVHLKINPAPIKLHCNIQSVLHINISNHSSRLECPASDRHCVSGVRKTLQVTECCWFYSHR